MKFKHRSPKLHLNILLIILFFVPTFYSCKDDSPRETQDGRNTFGMLVDGERWESPTIGYIPDAFYYPKYKCLVIYAENKYNEEEITLVVNNLDKKGIYNINFRISIPTEIDSTRLSNDDDLLTSYTLLSENESQINFSKFDTVNNIVAANFSLKLKNRSKEIINVTSGRFDLNLIVVGR